MRCDVVTQDKILGILGIQINYSIHIFQSLFFIVGMETVIAIGNVKTHPKTDKPYDEIKIVSVTLREPVKL